MSGSTKPLHRLDDLIDGRLMSKLDQLDVVSRKIFSGKLHGERRSRRRGQSVEFADFRPYAPGDDLRFVDWNIYGRLDRLFLKMFLEEEDLSLVIAIDASASMRTGNPDSFDYCRRLAMALGYVGLCNQHRVSMLAFNTEGIARVSNLRGRRKSSELATWLLQLEPQGASGFEAAMKAAALSRLGRGVMIVLSDFMLREGYEKGLGMVAGRGFDLFALQVLSPQQVDPSREGGVSGDMKLVDSESLGETEVTVTPALLKSYKERLDGWCGGLRQWCARRDVTHMVVESSVPVETMMLEYLRRRGLVR
ncbi:MAG: DUF58 domain-containing protein [Phycisphaerales bacterium]|nr:DUF58 domain-containing protein [Phycisphaerales bacterium]